MQHVITPATLLPFAVVVGSYLLGSLPFGLWIALRFYGVDIRTAGSGNIGSTNVSRTCGARAGAFVFLLDVAKGLIPPLLAPRSSSVWPIIAGMSAIIGHNYSIWLGFKGGKGIATSLGALLGIAPLVGFAAFAVFLIELLVLGWVSVGSILAAFSLPLFCALFYPGDAARLIFTIAAAVLAILKHRPNIARLRAGTEPRISRRAGTPPQ